MTLKQRVLLKIAMDMGRRGFLLSGALNVLGGQAKKGIHSNIKGITNATKKGIDYTIDGMSIGSESGLIGKMEKGIKTYKTVNEMLSYPAIWRRNRMMQKANKPTKEIIKRTVKDVISGDGKTTLTKKIKALGNIPSIATGEKAVYTKGGNLKEDLKNQWEYVKRKHITPKKRELETLYTLY